MSRLLEGDLGRHRRHEWIDHRFDQYRAGRFESLIEGRAALRRIVDGKSLGAASAGKTGEIDGLAARNRIRGCREKPSAPI